MAAGRISATILPVTGKLASGSAAALALRTAAKAGVKGGKPAKEFTEKEKRAQDRAMAEMLGMIKKPNASTAVKQTRAAKPKRVASRK